MARLPPTKDDRDANLQDLKTEVTEWGDKEKARLENEVLFMRSVLQGRTGSEQAGTQNLITVKDILQLEVEDFIAFGGDENRS